MSKFSEYLNLEIVTPNFPSKIENVTLKTLKKVKKQLKRIRNRAGTNFKKDQSAKRGAYWVTDQMETAINDLIKKAPK